MDDQELGRRRREAWELARTPRTMKALLEAVRRPDPGGDA
jgi:hypothetical protein